MFAGCFGILDAGAAGTRRVGFINKSLGDLRSPESESVCVCTQPLRWAESSTGESTVIINISIPCRHREGCDLVQGPSRFPPLLFLPLQAQGGGGQAGREKGLECARSRLSELCSGRDTALGVK